MEFGDKSVLICHAVSNERFVNGALFLCGKKLSESSVDYHNDMNGKVFEDWFDNLLLPKLPKEKNAVIVMNNPKYQSRLVEKAPSINVKKYDMITFAVRCAIWYHLCNLKNVKKTDRGVLILVKLQASACNFTEINTPQWVFFTFFKLYKWYQIAQHTHLW